MLALAASIAVATVGCSDPAGEPGRSLFDTVELGRVLPAAAAPAERSPTPRLVGWDVPDAVSHAPPDPDAPPPVGSLLLGRTAHTVVWLGPGERLQLPLPRSASSRRLVVDVGRATLPPAGDGAGTDAGAAEGRAGSGDFALRFELVPSSGDPILLHEARSPVELSAAPGAWSLVALDLAPDRRAGLDRLAIEYVDPGPPEAPRPAVGLGGLRLVPDPERRVGPDLLLLCDERAAPGAAGDAGDLRRDELLCWSQSPDPSLALASLLSGRAPSVHAEPGAGAPPLLGLPGGPASLGTLLRARGYRTLALVEEGTAAARRPVDLGFDSVRRTSVGQALADAESLLDRDPPGSWAVLVVRGEAATGVRAESGDAGPGEVNPGDGRAGAVPPRVVVRTALTGGAIDVDAPPAEPAFGEGDVRVPFALVLSEEFATIGFAPEAGRDDAGRDGAGALRLGGPVQHLDLLPTLCTVFGLERPPGLEGRSLVERAAGDALRPAAGDPERLLWAELPGRTYLLGKGVRRTVWIPTADGAGIERTVDLVGELPVPIEPSSARAGAIRARVEALEAIGSALHGRR